jgi:hypothetical protein
MSATTPLAALTRGILAGAVGTVAMTASERLEMSLTGREASTVPGQVGANLLPGKDPGSKADVAQLNSATHWVHGISMGAVRGLLDVAGLHGPAASAAHFGLVWGGDAALYRALGIADVPWRWEANELVTDMMHKGIYAAVTGVVYDALATHDPAPPK